MDTDVVVVGAGAAGLAAALSLAKRSVRVVVLEGRDRIGGRVRWEPVGSAGVPAELGAEFIHGPAAETAAFMREAGLTRTPIGDASWAWSSAGGLRAADDDDFSAGDVFERVRTLAEDESVDTFLRRFEHDPALQNLALRARGFVEGFEGADPARVSARSIADELQTGVDSTTSRPVPSYAPLFEHLGARCARAGVDLRLGSAVERIAWERGKVTIDARSERAGAFTLGARCAVITAPVGVLRQRGDAPAPFFAPPLPVEKQVALRGLEMGHAARVVLAFRTPFWETIDGGRFRDAAFFRCEGTAFAAYWTQAPQRERTIVAWAGGPRATAMDGVPAQARINRALDEFGTMFGQRDLARREYEAGVTYDWSTDPFAYGAYSYVVTGAGAARAALGTPVDDTLFFAGEATSTDGQGGTVSGAFGTGMRAAAEAARAIEAAGVPWKIVP
jgi:monoamine oxidase